MKNNIIIFSIIIFLLVIYLLNFNVGQNKDKENVSTLRNAPSFTLPDYEGIQVPSSDFLAKVMVINSWAVWCPFCKDELDDFARLQEEFGDEIVVIAIDRAESLSKAKGFTDSISITDKIMFLLDGTDSFYKSIGGFAMPETIFVNTEGKIALHKRGPMEFEEMKEHVLDIIKGSN